MRRHESFNLPTCHSIGIWISELLTHVKKLHGWLACTGPGIAIFGFRSRRQTGIQARDTTLAPSRIPSQNHDSEICQRAAHILNETLPEWVSVRACVQVQPSLFEDESADISRRKQTAAVIVRSGRQFGTHPSQVSWPGIIPHKSDLSSLHRQ